MQATAKQRERKLDPLTLNDQGGIRTFHTSFAGIPRNQELHTTSTTPQLPANDVTSCELR
jgi:hypothetical protein